ncbi:MAG: cation diffusion facilitator family transporter [Pseudomonadota bacterium]|nr:cation diffusion facilitator family transporter [Pseudomonadota bacterium]
MNKPRLIRIATYASVAIAVTLLLLKIVAWLQTDSVSILASLLDSAIDIIASVLILVAVQIAQTPPDKEHRFGHGKAEPLAALAQSVFITGSAIYLLIYAVERIINPQELTSPEIGLWLMLISLSLTFALVVFQRYVILQTQSTAIKSDSLHYISDIMANILVIIGLWLSHLLWLDPLLAVGIVAWILYSAFQIAREAGDQLLDRELPETVRLEIQKIILSTPEVQGFNDLRTYQSGPNRFVQVDLELDDKLTLKESHQITENVTSALVSAFDNLDVMIHQEPVSLHNDPSHHTWGKE